MCPIPVLSTDISFVTDEVGQGHYGELWEFAKRRKGLFAGVMYS